MLNGAPRSGKSSIVTAIQETFDGVWMNLGVDVFVREVTPPRHRPGIGLRPGDERPELRPLVRSMYVALYGSVAAHSREGLDVVVDVGHYDREVLAACAKVVAGLPVLFVGVTCRIEEIMRRRNAAQPGREGQYAVGTADEPVPLPVRRWQDGVAAVGPYDLEVDTSLLDPPACARVIGARLRDGPPGTRFADLARPETAVFRPLSPPKSDVTDPS
ncbi:MAG TPA: chloramphenicol phosphotransferase [Candidatus Limnocylindria bacterium]|nr:chloramphenicol phosphotransferase [Candidatus Limnocylindria bacterium]